MCSPLKGSKKGTTRVTRGSSRHEGHEGGIWGEEETCEGRKQEEQGE